MEAIYLKTFITQKVVPGIFSVFSQQLLGKLAPTRLIIPYYHMVSDNKVRHLTNLYPYKGIRQFTDDLEFLLKHFVPIGLADLLETIDRNGEFSRYSFHLTFDDGFRELDDVVTPILIRKGIPATFFVSSAFVDNKILGYEHKASILVEVIEEGIPESISHELSKLLVRNGLGDNNLSTVIMSVPYSRKEVLDELALYMKVDLDKYLADRKPYLDSSQIRALIGKGFTIGSHSIDHPLYANIGFEEQVRQTLESTRWIREAFLLNYGAFAFPHTDRNVDERFYTAIRDSSLVDVAFGTGGMINNKLSRHLQRFSLEKPILPAEKIINMQYAKKIVGRVRH